MGEVFRPSGGLGGKKGGEGVKVKGMVQKSGKQLNPQRVGGIKYDLGRYGITLKGSGELTNAREMLG